MKLLQGYAHKLGDRISTDAHVSARNHPIGTTRERLIAEMFRKLNPDLSKRIKKGDFIVAGQFFGTRSTFDDSIEIMRDAGIAAVIAKSFGHLFFRCAVNCGLLVITADTDEIETGDLLKVDLSQSKITNATQELTISFEHLPEFLLKIINDGGVVKHISKYGDYNLDLA
jgi:3-isopropylmalate/(R)-2-methylmalate dehydratase small subunit